MEKTHQQTLKDIIGLELHKKLTRGIQTQILEQHGSISIKVNPSHNNALLETLNTIITPSDQESQPRTPTIINLASHENNPKLYELTKQISKESQSYSDRYDYKQKTNRIVILDLTQVKPTTLPNDQLRQIGTIVGHIPTIIVLPPCDPENLPLSLRQTLGEYVGYNIDLSS